VKKLGVLGAGMMGAGIAYVSANAGIEVVLIDRRSGGAERARPIPRGCSTRG
jgi:3-hydroxyacyl-CoA dehydrogenase/enoyl-CoA hydratase/3-hydroxybutyryl-CoA epimerase